MSDKGSTKDPAGDPKSNITGGAGAEPTPATNTGGDPAPTNKAGEEIPKTALPADQVPDFAKGKPGPAEQGSGLKALAQPLANLKAN